MNLAGTVLVKNLTEGINLTELSDLSNQIIYLFIYLYKDLLKVHIQDLTQQLHGG